MCEVLVSQTYFQLLTKYFIAIGNWKLTINYFSDFQKWEKLPKTHNTHGCQKTHTSLTRAPTHPHACAMSHTAYDDLAAMMGVDSYDIFMKNLANISERVQYVSHFLVRTKKRNGPKNEPRQAPRQPGRTLPGPANPSPKGPQNAAGCL